MTWWIAELNKENEDCLIEDYQDIHDNDLTPRWRIERKLELLKARKINCGICPYHRNENYTGQNHRDDRKKNHRRQ